MGLYKQIGYRNISLSSGDITNSLLKALNAENGLDLKALTARLSSSEQEALETNLIRGVIEKFTKDGITDFSKVNNTLENAPFESKRAVEIMGELNKKAPILNNTSSLLEKLTAINPKAKELQQGIGHSVTGALMTMKRNLAVERLKSLLPVLGNDASLKNHIRNAINNAGDLKSVINNLEKIEIKDAPENSTKLLEAFKNEIKALREEAQTAEIKGDNFITKESPAPKSDLNVKISVDDWVRELGGINANKQIKADLTKLYEKHKELFTKPSDVFRLIKAVKENPTFFYNNNEPNTALIGKILDNGKLGKIGIQKDYDSEYLKLNHATYSSKADKENKRLLRRNEKSHLVGSPTPTQLTLGKATEPTADGAKALLDEKELTRTPALETSLNKEDGELLKLSNKSIIPQKDKNTKTINASPHIASGLLGGTANGADENGNVSPEEFAKGFIYALFGSKITAEGVKRVSPELYNKILIISKKPSEEIKKIVDNAGVDKLAKQEKRGIYNVTYNGKNSTQIKQDLDNINDAIKYERGNIGKGAKHISIRHLDDENKAGFVTKEELLNLGENVRNFIKEHKEPFVNKKNARIYEWEDDKGVRFKLVVSNKNGEGRGLPLGKSQDVSSITNDLRPATKKGLSPSGSLDDIITFYSDRNLKEPMKFENPKLKLLDAIDTSSDKVGLVKKVLLNKDISDGVKAKAVNRLTKNKISQGAKTSYILTLAFL
ncbi:hypothetical protein [Campylobacter concisus]|uniref:hypothetical protein n=1 Tax=Campylobacter concisus TaxID=199 RepID=UPI00165F2827|nr:hypothetical protein [Campylobacter concisus]